MKDRQVSFRIDAATRAALDGAAAAAEVGISTLLGSIVTEWAKTQRRPQVREAENGCTKRTYALAHLVTATGRARIVRAHEARITPEQLDALYAALRLVFTP